MNERSKQSVAVVAVVLAVLTYMVVAGTPRLNADVANGRYENECCGTLELKNGRLSFRGKYSEYVIETDKGGAYVLPSAYVGVLDGRTIEFERGSDGLKLRLDDPKHPTQIEIVGRGQGDDDYVFRRLRD